MPADLHAPDPTLAALAGTLVEVIEGFPSEAHLPESLHADGLPMMAVNASWFAVPCRDCFPDTPPLGARWVDPSRPYAGEWLDDPDLAWQVPDREATDVG